MFKKALSIVLLLVFMGSTTYIAGCQNEEKREDKLKVETPNKEIKIQEKKHD